MTGSRHPLQRRNETPAAATTPARPERAAGSAAGPAGRLGWSIGRVAVAQPEVSDPGEAGPSVAGTDNGDGLRVSDPDDRFEREASRTADRAMAAPATGRPTPAIPAGDGAAGHTVQRVKVTWELKPGRQDEKFESETTDYSQKLQSRQKSESVKKVEASNYLHFAVNEFKFEDEKTRRTFKVDDWVNPKGKENREAYYKVKADSAFRRAAQDVLKTSFTLSQPLPRLFLTYLPEADAGVWNSDQRASELAVGGKGAALEWERKMFMYLTSLSAASDVRETVMDTLNITSTELSVGDEHERVMFDWRKITAAGRRWVVANLRSSRPVHPRPPVDKKNDYEDLASVFADASPGLRRLAGLKLFDVETQDPGRFKERAKIQESQRAVTAQLKKGDADSLQAAYNHLRFLLWSEWRACYEVLNDLDTGDKSEKTEEEKPTDVPTPSATTEEFKEKPPSETVGKQPRSPRHADRALKRAVPSALRKAGTGKANASDVKGILQQGIQKRTRIAEIIERLGGVGVASALALAILVAVVTIAASLIR
jgi:hypothetical protein